jgi:tetratricopeptide (TPR) repeat protein
MIDQPAQPPFPPSTPSPTAGTVHSSGDQGVNVAVNQGTINYLVQGIRQGKSQALQQLPRDIENFVGREIPLQQVKQILQQQGNTAIAISAVSGMGGVGKSALAIHVAHQLKEQYPDAQLYINLQGADVTTSRDPLSVLGEFLRELGLEDVQIGQMNLESRSKWWRSLLAQLRAIVILDNARDAAQVRHLLPGSGNGCALIITSRQQLTLDRVDQLRLEQMPPPEGRLLLATISERTFEQAEVEIATEIVEYCGRLPLAIKIVGALLRKRRQISLAEAHTALRNERQRLTAFAQQHQILQTDEYLDVRSSLNLSLQWLDPEVQGILAQVAAIPGVDFGLDIAQVVTDLPDRELLQAGLDLLADEQLLEAKGNGRYQLHDLVRLLGQEQLGPEMTTTLSFKALARYIEMATLLHSGLSRQLEPEQLDALAGARESLDQVKDRMVQTALDWFDQEWQNLTTSVIYCHQTQQWHQTVQLALLLDNFAMRKGYRAELPKLYHLAHDAAIKQNDPWGEANTLKAIGDVLQFLDQSQEALNRYQTALTIYRQVGDRLGEANTLQAIGDVLQFLKQSQEALNRYQTALTIYRQVGARLGEANTLKAIGDVLQFLKQSQEALNRYQTALTIYRQVGARLGEANTLQAIGDLEVDPQIGLQRVQAAMNIYTDIGDQYSQARILATSFAPLYLKLNQPFQAQRSYEQALQYFEKIELEAGINYCKEQLKNLSQPSTGVSLTVAPQIGQDARSPKKFSCQKVPFWFWVGLGLAIALLIWWLKR